MFYLQLRKDNSVVVLIKQTGDLGNFVWTVLVVKKKKKKNSSTEKNQFKSKAERRRVVSKHLHAQHTLCTCVAANLRIWGAVKCSSSILVATYFPRSEFDLKTAVGELELELLRMGREPIEGGRVSCLENVFVFNLTFFFVFKAEISPSRYNARLVYLSAVCGFAKRACLRVRSCCTCH